MFFFSVMSSTILDAKVTELAHYLQELFKEQFLLWKKSCILLILTEMCVFINRILYGTRRSEGLSFSI